MARQRVRLSVEERRRQLLELGLEVFGRSPYDAVSIDAIAAAAGVSQGLLFHYFAGKRDYYLEVLRFAAEQLLRETTRAREGTLAERLFLGLRAYFRFVEEHAPAYATLLRAGDDAAVAGVLDGTRGRFLETIRSELVKFQPRQRSAAARLRASLRGWIGLVEALSLDWIDHRDLDRDALVELATRAMAGLVPGAAEALSGTPLAPA
jgi:AcrR family transcriptional regulator